MSRTNNNCLSQLLVALICVFLPLMGSACRSSRAETTHSSSDPNASSKPITVEVVTAKQQDVPVTAQWVAVTDGNTNAQIQPQVSGYLISQLYKEGSVVHKGQVLFEIDPRPLQAVLDQAKGQLAQARAQVVQAQSQVAQSEAQLELAEINVRRDTPLVEARATSRSTFDTEVKTRDADKAAVANANASVASAQAAVVSASASVESAQLNVGFTKVRSLIDGVAGQASVQVGNLVSTSSVLTSVSQLNPLKVYFSLSEQEYLALSSQLKRKGQPNLLNSGSAIPLSLTLANSEVYPYHGHIIFVDRSLSAQTGSIRLAAVFANPNNLLRPGQFGRVSADTGVIHDAVLVPQRASNELQGADQVVVIDSTNTAHIRTVKLGEEIGHDVVVSSGVKTGERVVVEGNDKVKEGMKVAPQTSAVKEESGADAQKPEEKK